MCIFYLIRILYIYQGTDWPIQITLSTRQLHKFSAVKEASFGLWFHVFLVFTCPTFIRIHTKIRQAGSTNKWILLNYQQLVLFSFRGDVLSFIPLTQRSELNFVLCPPIIFGICIYLYARKLGKLCEGGAGKYGAI